jgi:hypothetical protein
MLKSPSSRVTVWGSCHCVSAPGLSVPISRKQVGAPSQHVGPVHGGHGGHGVQMGGAVVFKL